METKNTSHNHSTETKRPTFDVLFMKTALLFSTRSTCQRIKTAAVIVKDFNIVSIGYNGVGKDCTHCTDVWKKLYETKAVAGEYASYEDFLLSEEFATEHHKWSSVNEFHGERNAILQTEESLRGASIYTVYSPCINCAMDISKKGITKLYYNKIYHRDESGLDFCKRKGIEIYEITDEELNFIA